MYKLYKTNDKMVSVILDGVYYDIPFDPLNTDYQAYLKWLEEGNTPLPADESNLIENNNGIN